MKTTHNVTQFTAQLRMGSPQNNNKARGAAVCTILITIALTFCCIRSNITSEEDLHVVKSYNKSIKNHAPLNHKNDTEDYFSMIISEDDIETFAVNLPGTLPNFRNLCWMETVPTNFSYFTDSFYYKLYRMFPNIEQWSRWGKVLDNMQQVIDKRKEENSDNLGWRIRCFPYFFLLGFTKCGTTDLFVALSHIPDIVHPLTKEPNFWHIYRLRYKTQKAGVILPRPRLSDYLDIYDEAAEQIRQHTIMTEDGVVYHPGVVGDLDPKTIWFYPKWKHIKGNKNRDEPKYLTQHHLYHINPKAKFLVMLRNPVDRIFSHYKFFSRLENATVRPEEFHDDIQCLVEELETCFREKSIRCCVYKALIHTDPKTNILKRSVIGSLYPVFINDWLSVFPREQFLFIKSEEYFKNRTAIIMDIIDFLQLNRTIPDESLNTIRNLQVVNTSIKTVFWKRTRALLWNFLRPFNENLVTLLRSKKWTWAPS